MDALSDEAGRQSIVVTDYGHFFVLRSNLRRRPKDMRDADAEDGSLFPSGGASTLGCEKRLAPAVLSCHRPTKACKANLSWGSTSAACKALFTQVSCER